MIPTVCLPFFRHSKQLLLWVLLSSMLVGCGDQGDSSVIASSVSSSKPSSFSLSSMSSTSSVSSVASTPSSSISSSSSSMSSSSASSMAAQSFCPANEPCKILPFGDSITDGYKQDPGGYRIELFKKAMDAGKDITFVGGRKNGPTTVAGKPFPRQHQGHSGWTIGEVGGNDGIRTLLPSPALDEDPNIILLHIGTNDLKKSPSGMADRLEGLVDKILDDAPNALLVVSSLVPSNKSSYPNSVVIKYNAQIPGIVQSRADLGFNIIFLDQYEGFPVSELGDKLHPSAAGYARMASKWYGAIEKYLR